MIDNYGNDLVGVIKDYLAELDIREIIHGKNTFEAKKPKIRSILGYLGVLDKFVSQEEWTEIAKEKREKRRKARMEKKAAERAESESLPKLPKRIRENLEIEQLMLKNHMEEDEEW